MSAVLSSRAAATPIAAASSTAWALTLLRLALGIMWTAHALLKPLVFTFAGTARYFESVGLAGALVAPVFAAEVAIGLALILGAYARQTALLSLPMLLVIVWVHLPNGWVHVAQGGGWEYPAFLCISSIVLWLAGDGALALRRSARFVPGAR
ncbi:MAG: DoxX family protein [Burkholderiaceae bacterium]|nr:DoxX family protein [Burkholderiaceae bacterium]